MAARNVSLLRNVHRLTWRSYTVPDITIGPLFKIPAVGIGDENVQMMLHPYALAHLERKRRNHDAW